MTNKQFLDHYRIQRTACMALATQIDDMRQSMNHSCTSGMDDMTNLINDMDSTLRDRMDAIAPMGQHIAMAIASLDDVVAQKVLSMRYIQMMDNRTISQAIHYSESGVRGIYHRVIPLLNLVDAAEMFKKQNTQKHKKVV